MIAAIKPKASMVANVQLAVYPMVTTPGVSRLAKLSRCQTCASLGVASFIAQENLVMHRNKNERSQNSKDVIGK
jgi:hypothetical protein